MLRRWPGGLYLLAAPVVFALAASVLHQYPFHGRLLIFLVPSVQMLVAEGAAAVSRPGGWRLAVVVGAFLLFQPAIDAFWYRFIQPLDHDRVRFPRRPATRPARLPQGASDRDGRQP